MEAQFSMSEEELKYRINDLNQPKVYVLDDEKLFYFYIIDYDLEPNNNIEFMYTYQQESINRVLTNYIPNSEHNFVTLEWSDYDIVPVELTDGYKERYLDNKYNEEELKNIVFEHFTNLIEYGRPIYQKNEYYYALCIPYLIQKRFLKTKSARF